MRAYGLILITLLSIASARAQSAPSNEVGTPAPSVTAPEARQGKTQKPRVDLTFELEAYPHAPLITFTEEHTSSVTVGVFDGRITEEVIVTNQVMTPAAPTAPGETPVAAEPTVEEKTEVREICQFSIPYQPDQIIPPKKPEDPPVKVKATYKIHAKLPGCARLNFVTSSQVLVEITPKSQAGQTLSIDTNSKLSESISFPEYSEQVRIRLAPLLGIQQVNSTGEDGRSLDGSPGLGFGFHAHATYRRWRAQFGGLFSPKTYTTQSSGEQKAMFMRLQLGAAYDLPIPVGFLSSSGRFVLQPMVLLDLSSHSTADIRTNFGDHLSVFSAIPYGGFAFYQKQSQTRAHVGYAYGINKSVSGLTAIVSYKRLMTSGVDLFAQGQYRGQSWKIYQGIPGNNTDWSAMVGAEFDLKYFKFGAKKP